jgi:hypothetical protein
MKAFLPLITIILMMPIVAKPFAGASIITPQINEPVKKTTPKFSFKQSKAFAEWSLGRKLKLKEKIALRLQTSLHTSKAADEGKANTNAVLGFIFAVAGLFLWPFFIPGLILSKKALNSEKENPGVLTSTNLTLAKIGKIASLVGLIIIAIAIIVIAIVIGSGGFAAL